MMEIGTEFSITLAVERQVNKHTCNSECGDGKSVVTPSLFSIS